MTSTTKATPELADYTVTVVLSTDFRRTCFHRTADQFAQAARDGVYGEDGFTFTVQAPDDRLAADIAFAVCNSSRDQLFCDRKYALQAAEYRLPGRRSLSVGDVVIVSGQGWQPPVRLGVVGVGFVEF